MVDKHADEQLRQTIERRIVSSANNIMTGSGLECFDDATTQVFLSAWRDLVQYYREYDDILMNIRLM